MSDLEARYLVPKCSDPDYVSVVNQIIEREKIEFLHPQPDAEVAMISAAREQFGCPVFLPDPPSFRFVITKH